jgi:hypothetical protein
MTNCTYFDLGKTRVVSILYYTKLLFTVKYLRMLQTGKGLHQRAERRSLDWMILKIPCNKVTDKSE